jgi:hypothetical protein
MRNSLNRKRKNKIQKTSLLKEKLVATAFVAKRRANKLLIKVVTKSGAEEVFVGKFIIVTR